eukprot:TRINITY_DN6198_c0_g2_i1.p1 TRINITY_DN6198_c0_g2~~TRINITY_DN6198_c0_g2_i1.p1  ORF type:complete len:683 (+),score=132.60 TRINITY_DN6198_c0_g2_i1:62-2110(+)
MSAPTPRLLANASDVCTQKILVVAKAAGIDLALDVTKQNLLFPELHRGGQVIQYTNAILRHLGRCREDSDLYGNTMFESAQVDAWLDWAEGELADQNSPHLDRAIEALERHLGDRVYLAGHRYTIADASVSCSINAFRQQGALGDLPRSTKRWLNTCLAQDGFVAVEKKSTEMAVAAKASVVADAPPSCVVTGERPVVAEYSKFVGGRTRVDRVLQGGGVDMIGKVINVCGWVKTKRDGGKGQFAFIELTDGSCATSLQVVIEQSAKGFDSLHGQCGTGASLRCTGEVVKSPGAGQSVELLCKGINHEVELFGGVDAKDYPLSKKHHSSEHLRSIAHLRPRSNIIGAVARVRSALAFATHSFFRSKGFQYVHTPLITASDCEGAGEMFQVTTMLNGAETKGLPMAEGKLDYTKDFFGKPAYLTVSGQLSVENYCCALSNVYTFGPTFRAENSNTSRHLAEFWMIEPELAFADINDDMACAEDYLKHCVRHVYENNREDLDFFDKQVEKGLITRLENLLAEPFARVTYTEAVDILIAESPKANFILPVEWGMDLKSEHERYLTEKVKKKPTIVYNYPKDIKPFYMRLNDDGRTVAAMDCLVPQIGEVIGGSQREERLDMLDARIAEGGLNAADYWWYRDLRRFGSVPHAGFGLGFERLIMLVTGVENIRDVIPYPRYPGHAEF